MFVQVLVDEIAAGRTTERSSNDRDEVYFVLAGNTSRGQIEIPRVSPPPPEDYYDLKSGQNKKNIMLWQGDIGNGEYAYITVVVREQDNAQLEAIALAVAAGVLGFVAIFVPPVGGPALSVLGDAAKSFVDSLRNDGDQTIGAFAIHISMQEQNLPVDWVRIRNVTIASQSDLSAVFDANGSDAHYTVRVSVKRPPELTPTQHVFGLNADGDVIHYYWTPQDGWRAENKTQDYPHIGSACRIVSGLVVDSFQSADTPTQHVFGLSADGDVIHYYWTPQDGWAAENKTQDYAHIGERYRIASGLVVDSFKA